MTNTIALTVSQCYGAVSDVPVDLKLQTRAGTIQAVPSEDIKSVIHSMIQKCGWSLQATQYDDKLDRLCRKALFELDTRLDESHKVQRYVPVGVNITHDMYGHLEGENRLLYTALYTILITYLDDKCTEDITLIHSFGDCLLNGAIGGTYEPAISALVKMLPHTPQYFGPFSSNIISAALQSFMTGLMLDHETREMQLVRAPIEYAHYTRQVNGIAEPYAVFGFPKDVPINLYVTVIPSMSKMICHVNDILSFYKEELAGESENYISTLCAIRGVSKLQVLEELSNETSRMNRENQEILSANKSVLDCYNKTMQGYVTFHIATARYRLEELGF